MTTAETKEYLGMIVTLEKESYTQRILINSMWHKIENLGKEKYIAEPQKESVTDEADYFLLFVGAGILFVSIWLMDVIGWLLGFLCILGMIVGLLVIIGGCIGLSAGSRMRKEAERKYQEEVKAYNRSRELDGQRIVRECIQKDFLRKQLPILQKEHERTQRVLQKLYDYNIIHPKYRGFVPVCSLYGYFDTGVCTKLEGHEGAYNKYDTESRLDRIICKLDDVIRRLDEIADNQNTLYYAIQDSNRKVGQLLDNSVKMANQLTNIQAQGAELNSRMAQLQTTSDLNLYVNACTKRELEYMNRANRIF